jgi:hypothetical protein
MTYHLLSPAPASEYLSEGEEVQLVDAQNESQESVEFDKVEDDDPPEKKTLHTNTQLQLHSDETTEIGDIKEDTQLKMEALRLDTPSLLGLNATSCVSETEDEVLLDAGTMHPNIQRLLDETAMAEEEVLRHQTRLRRGDSALEGKLNFLNVPELTVC